MKRYLINECIDPETAVHSKHNRVALVDDAVDIAVEVRAGHFRTILLSLRLWCD